MRRRAVLLAALLAAGPPAAAASIIDSQIVGPPEAVCKQHRMNFGRARAVALFEVVSVRQDGSETDPALPKLDEGVATAKVVAVYKGSLPTGLFAYRVSEQWRNDEALSLFPKVGSRFVGYLPKAAGKPDLNKGWQQTPERYAFELNACEAAGRLAADPARS